MHLILRNILFRPWLLLIVLSLLICLQRVHTYNEPTDRDIADYAVTAHEILLGKSIYSGFLMDQKPPAIHFTYGLAELIIGYGRQQIYFLGIVAAIATLLGVYWIGSSISRATGIWATAFWTVICSSLPLEANQPNSEVFINAWILLGIANLLQQAKRPICNYWWAVGAGFCFAIATLYKHSTVVLPILISLSYFFFPLSFRKRKEALFTLLIIGSIGFLFWSSIFIYFGMTGRFNSVIKCLFIYNKYYSGDISNNIFSFTNFFPISLRDMIPLFILVLIGIPFALKQKVFNEIIFITVLAVGTMAAVALPGRFYPHYYQLWFPFLLVGSIYSLKWYNCATGHSLFLKNMLPAVTFLVLVFTIFPSYFLPSPEWSKRKYGNIFLITNKLAKELNNLLLPNESFYQIGSQTQLYFDTKQRPISYLYDNGVFDGPFSNEFSEILLKTLQEKKPDLIVIEKYTIPKISPNSHLLPWIDSKYDEAPYIFNRDPLFLFVRKDSVLKQRLLAPNKN